MRYPKRSPGGFSLTEILVVISVFSLMMFLVVTNLRTPRASASSTSMADILAQELRTARKRAQSRGTAVAVVIPSAAGTRPVSQSLYTVEGWPNPKINQVRNFSGEFTNGYFFVGTWPTLPSDTPRLAPTYPGPFSIEKWLTPSTKDYVICFNADGSVVTNDLPWFAGELRILACSGVNFAGTSQPTGTAVAGASKINYFQANTVFQPQTVTLSQTGVVAVVPGAKGASSALTLGAGSAEPTLPPAAPPALNGVANSAPVICQVDAYPQKNPDIPLGFTTSIGSKGYVTVVVRANDPNGGDRLSCSLTATNSSGAAVGQWSQVANSCQMRFDPNDTNTTNGYPSGCWKSTWVWTPPPNGNYGPPGEGFNLTCTVVDDRGANVVATGAAQVISLLVKDEGHVIFAGGYGGRSRLFQLTPTGTTPQMISPASWNYDCFQPTVSPDGTKILYCADTSGGTNTSIWMMNADGSLGPNSPKRVLAATTAPLNSPAWDPKGSNFVCCEGPLSTTPYIVNASITGATPKNYLAAGSQPRISSKGEMVYVNHNGSVVRIPATPAWTAYPNEAAVPASPGFPVVAASGAYPSFDRSGRRIFYVENPGHDRVFEVDIASGTSFMAAGFLTDVDGPLSFSPDNSRAVFGHVNNTPSYGVFVDYSPGIFLGQSTVPFGLFPYGPVNGSINYVYYPSWSSR